LNINTQATEIQKSTGRRPNKFVVGRNVFEKLRANTTFTNLGFAQGVGFLPEESIKNAIGSLIGMEVIIAEASYDTAVLGQTASNDWLWGKDAWIIYSPNNASLFEPTFGMQPFMDGVTVRTYEIDERRVTAVEAFQSYDLVADYKVGYHFDAVIS